ncbi:hypothetical protein DUZ99_02085 [Xylanibacillus composti]|uniref:Uncharacterized protein n=1 Tax=Xylanibacillus composti TaxID=1572762 RepID=A0A8J4M0U7_9BACL|nr:hypothetical protein [Xylanibacillus composti]MDT9723784.1 hypothetical protein [Xylanibacillus composti]GIQ67445.1 hypothetical protein XYCOK13_02690 [Xylanibacillus composti]
MEKSNECSKDDLLLQHELEIAQGIMESKEQYRKIIKAAVARWVKDFQDNRIEIQTVDDLRKLIELDIELQKDETS